MKLIARFIPMAFLLGACLYAQQPQDPQQQPTTPQTPSSTQPSTPAPDPSSQRPGSQMPGSQPSTPSSQQPQANPSENQPSTDQAKTDVTVTGKVVKSQGSLVIKDDASNSTYKVDNEDQLKQYMGKNVKVTGTLDAQTKTIHISNIEVSAS